MAEVYVARQPIFNTALEVEGYELLFRGGSDAEALVADAEGATATVVLNSFTEIGLERIVGPHTAWINVSREFVLSGLARTVPPGVVGLEILEDQLIDDRFTTAVSALKAQGYRLALDDFEYSPSAEALLPLADVIKLDLMALGRDGVARHVERLKPYGALILAEKLETRDDHAYCAAIGCDLFQGFFFRQPELVHNRGVSANRLSLLQTVSALQDPTVDLHALEQLISRDVALSFRLLRYMNSAFFGLRCEVRSIGQALALLGVERLRHWTTLSLLASIDDKPAELTVTALVRARFCERAGGQRRGGPSAGQLFTLGLFSVIDALMDAPISEVIASIPFPEEMRMALVEHAGEQGQLLECVTALEAADFDRAQSLVRDAGELYLESLVWANEAAEALFGQAADPVAA
jgi:EAL and modified HD-GYP domain-containing signal transduction protein